MEIKTNIKKTNLKLTPEISSIIDEKVNHLKKFMSLKKDSTPILDIQIENKYGDHHKQGYIYRAELNLQYMGKVLRTESKAEDLISALNDAFDEMVRRVKKIREKKIDRVRDGAKKLKKMLRFGRGE